MLWTSNLYLISFNLKSFPLDLPLSAIVKGIFPVYKLPLNTGKPHWGLHRSFSSAGWASPALSPCFCRRGVSALWLSSWPSSGFVPIAPHLSCVGGLSPGHSNPNTASLGQNRGGQTHPSPYWPLFWCSSPQCRWPVVLRVQPISSGKWNVYSPTRHTFQSHEVVSDLLCYYRKGILNDTICVVIIRCHITK